MVSLGIFALLASLTVGHASPVAEKRAASYELGCYTPAAVIGLPLVLPLMSVEVCRSFCAFSKTTYAGLAAGTTCSCANSITSIKSLDLFCDAPCGGNIFEKCGGFNLFQNVFLVAGASPVSQSVSSTTTVLPATTKSSTVATSTTLTTAAQTTTTGTLSPVTTKSATTSTAAQTSSSTSTSTSSPMRSSTISTSTTTIAAATTTGNIVASSTSTTTTSSINTIPTTTSISTSVVSTTTAAPAQTATAINGYSLTISGQTAAANGNGYLSSYILTDGYNIAECAQSCTITDSCAFFNIYQQQSGSSYSDVCVLWQYVQQPAEFNNYYNNGQPITYSAGYAKIVAAITTTTAFAPVASTTTAPATLTTSTSTSTAGATASCSNAGAPSGYTAGFQCLSAAADGNGYLSSYIDSTATSYTALVNDCAASCSLDSNCAFFNVYQENSQTTNICVLWNTVKDASTATNTYNNGIPITNSNGYIRAVNVIPTSTAASSATATACSNALASGYAVCYNGQRVVNGACVN